MLNSAGSEEVRAADIGDLPSKVFLDTNIVNCLVKWGEEIFDLVTIPDDIPLALASDIYALRNIFMVCRRANFDLLISPKTMTELDDTSDQLLRANLVGFGADFLRRLPLSSIEAGDIARARDLARRLEGISYLAPLKDAGDRELIGHAVAFGCDTFCTRDVRTILRKRDRLTAIPLRFVTPSEWWDILRPWAGLWV